MVPAALNFRPRLVLISAGFDAHRLDPTEGCMLETDDLAQMACPSATSPRVSEHRPAPVLGGYDRGALADCVIANAQSARRRGEAESIAPDPILTSRAASQPGHYWRL